jgi:hypothetical protein
MCGMSNLATPAQPVIAVAFVDRCIRLFALPTFEEKVTLLKLRSMLSFYNYSTFVFVISSGCDLGEVHYPVVERRSGRALLLRRQQWIGQSVVLEGAGGGGEPAGGAEGQRVVQSQ